MVTAVKFMSFVVVLLTVIFCGVIYCFLYCICYFLHFLLCLNYEHDLFVREDVVENLFIYQFFVESFNDGSFGLLYLSRPNSSLQSIKVNLKYVPKSILFLETIDKNFQKLPPVGGYLYFIPLIFMLIAVQFIQKFIDDIQMNILYSFIMIKFHLLYGTFLLKYVLFNTLHENTFSKLIVFQPNENVVFVISQHK